MRSDPKTLDIYSAGEEGRGFDAMMRRLMLFLPRTDHDRVRAAVSASFTPRAVGAHRDLARRVVDRLIDELPEGEFDLVRDFAYPLPVFMICQMMGIPHEDVPLFIDWAHAFAARGDIGLRLSAETVRAGEAATAGLQDYFIRLIAQRRGHPGDDLMSAMIAGRVGGVALSDDEIAAAAVLLLQAGHSTTADLIGMGTRHLLLNPDQWRLLIERPDIAAGAVMELLRYDSSVQMSHRVAVEDFEVGGHVVRKDELCLLLNGAANRDPAVVPDPDRLDLRRTGINTAPFGGGPYMCLGQYLARVELQEAFMGLTRRLPGLTLCSDEVVHAGGVTLRGIAALPVTGNHQHRHAAQSRFH